MQWDGIIFEGAILFLCTCVLTREFFHFHPIVVWMPQKYLVNTGHKEVGRAPLIDFQKCFLNKVFYRLMLFRKFKFYTWLTISGKKSIKKGQKMTKKSQIWFIGNAFSKFFLSWLIWNILMAIIWWKKLVLLYTFGLISSHLGNVH